MITEINEEPTEPATPGRLLREARVKNRLSEQDVADSLNLKLTIIRAIEQNEFDTIPVPTFAKGYLRSYAKLLGVDERKVIDLYNGLGLKSKDSQADFKSFSKRTKLEKHDNRLMLLTYFILFVIIALAVAWWWQRSDVLTALNSETTVSSPANAELVVSNVSAHSPDLKPNQLEAPLGHDEHQAIMSQTEAKEGILTESNADSSMDEVIESSELSNTESIDADLDDISSNEVIKQPSKNESEHLIVNSFSQAEHRQEQPNNLEQISMQFSEDCWINVIDATGERIAYGVKTKGRLMQVSGVAPFEITLGAPENVQVSYQTAAIDMNRFKKGMVARFSLPLENE